MRYNFKSIEKKWQKKWESKKVFRAKEGKKKFYVLEMYPYPSGSGLHMGHAFNYTIGDVFARMKRMQNFRVLYPMGYDSFGLPAENAAIRAGENPKTHTERAIKNFIRQQKSLGLSYDWSRLITTHSSEYYKWNQLFFLKFLEKGLVYRKKSPVNWCPKCQTVLANEQVHSGKCEYHPDTDVEIKQLEQWFIKTTEYSEELLEEIEKVDWPSRIKTMQKNWIGKSRGTEIDFEISREKWSVFTTRPDTIFGVTFMVVSAQHPNLMEIVTKEREGEVKEFLRKIKSVSEKELDMLAKEGVFTGSYAVNPINGKKVPVYAGNFVVADYGSGMVMGVPAHDQRDFEFAEKYGIPIKVVVEPKEFEIYEREGQIPRAYPGEGTLADSGEFNGMDSLKARDKITEFLRKKGVGRKKTQYKFRDWLVSRQRYWGTPIPIIYCNTCGIVPVPEEDLPVKLPQRVKFGKGNPLETNKSFLEVKCPRCNGKARRETDTMDTFFDSAWYYLRYCDPKNKKKPFDEKKVSAWMPVDQYIGGAEHATMHLIYARFFTKALRDLGFLEFDEPFLKLFNQGMLHGLDGEKMSKSKGNVILPEEVSRKYGIDTARLFLVSIASPDKDIAWSEKGIEGSYRFIGRVMEYFHKFEPGTSGARAESKLHKSIQDITQDIADFNHNFAIIKIRDLFESLPEKISKKDAGIFLKLLHPFCPHLTEELWHNLGNKSFISLEKWPKADKSKIDEKFEKEEELADKLVNDVVNVLGIVRSKGKKPAKLYVYVLPNEKKFYQSSETLVEKRTGLRPEIYAVNDKAKYDPEGKSGKVKPGKPGIYLE